MLNVVLYDNKIFDNIVSIPPQILWISFAVIFSIAVLMSLVLFYHWRKYGRGNLRINSAAILYILGVAILLGVIFIAITGYVKSL